MTDENLIMIYDLLSGENIGSHGWNSTGTLFLKRRRYQVFPLFLFLVHTHIYSYTLGIW